MQHLNKIAFVLSLGLFVYVFFLQTKISKLEQALSTSSATNNTSKPEEKEEYEVAITMSRIHLFMNKLWFSSKNNNWELAHFYTHEIEEGLEEMMEHNPEEDGLKLGPLVKAMAMKQVEELENAIEKKDNQVFSKAYLNLTTACNSCHDATQHGFINIKQPETPTLDNQDFSVENK